MEGVGLGLARNIVQRYALETGSEQGFGIDEKVAHHCFGRPDNPHSISPGGPGKLDLEDRLKSTRWLARSRSDRLADLRFSSDMVVVIGALPFVARRRPTRCTHRRDQLRHP